MKSRGQFDEETEESDQSGAFLLKSLRVTSFRGRQITILMSDSMPPYFDRRLKFDDTWIENSPRSNHTAGPRRAEHAVIRRVTTAGDHRDVAADTVGIKNAMLSPLDVWTALFSQLTRLEDVLQILESVGDNGLESCEIIKSADPTGHKIADMLDDLCFADCAYGEIVTLGLAGIQRLHGISRIGSRQLVFPSPSSGRRCSTGRTRRY
jgi:hypothetical protein